MNNTINNYIQHDKPEYSEIMEDYISENLEHGKSHHTKEEQLGLIEVYNNISKNKISPFTMLNIDLMYILQTIYSKCPYPCAEYRKVNCCISESDVKTLEYSKISSAINILNAEYMSLLNLKNDILNGKSMEVEDFIKGAIRLKCKIIEIHPFKDGNGRTTRALFNYLLRQLDLPPVCTNIEERATYLKAMDSAIRENNFALIDKFYFEKIENSIIKLEVGKTKRR